VIEKEGKYILEKSNIQKDRILEKFIYRATTLREGYLRQDIKDTKGDKNGGKDSE